MIPWVDEILTLVGALTSKTCLPIYELDAGNVRNPNGKIRPFNNPRGFTADPLYLPQGRVPDNLQMSGWRLAHAIVKTDCLRRMRFGQLYAVGTMMQLAALVNMQSRPIGLRPGTSNLLMDFAGTSFSGRIGQGFALLFMEHLGYCFAGHFGRISGQKGPDFVFEQSAGVQSLVEAKGLLTSPGGTPQIKAALSSALVQLGPPGLYPSTSNFAVATVVRECTDQAIEPSMIAFAKEQQAAPAPAAPSDAVRRDNYSAWLLAMGMTAEARELRLRRVGRKARSKLIPILEHRGHEFALTIAGSNIGAEGLGLLSGRRRQRTIAGIEFERLKTLGRAVANPWNNELANAAPFFDDSAGIELETSDGFTGSTLADGTLFGEIDESRLRALESKEVAL